MSTAENEKPVPSAATLAALYSTGLQQNRLGSALELDRIFRKTIAKKHLIRIVICVVQVIVINGLHSII